MLLGSDDDPGKLAVVHVLRANGYGPAGRHPGAMGSSTLSSTDPWLRAVAACESAWRISRGGVEQAAVRGTSSHVAPVNSSRS